MREGWKEQLLQLGKPRGADVGVIHLAASSHTTFPIELFLHGPHLPSQRPLLPQSLCSVLTSLGLRHFQRFARQAPSYSWV